MAGQQNWTALVGKYTISILNATHRG
jgi:hypothetical protein